MVPSMPRAMGFSPGGGPASLGAFFLAAHSAPGFSGTGEHRIPAAPFVAQAAERWHGGCFSQPSPASRGSRFLKE